ncbi:hypothetical protein CPB84DRAFT_1752620 [Gymnopilus junonius]|uniref:Uncharacterized protein n=1 Tax=Gymnopilus junonius TaxID=109634 RepID=A0A9P5NCJ5_GYMJU|nr:hypothetical protein CPB84DRAFT_1752620 [Gymnopilus junonius]
MAWVFFISFSLSAHLRCSASSSASSSSLSYKSPLSALTFFVGWVPTPQLSSSSPQSSSAGAPSSTQKYHHPPIPPSAGVIVSWKLIRYPGPSRDFGMVSFFGGLIGVGVLVLADGGRASHAAAPQVRIASPQVSAALP